MVSREGSESVKTKEDEFLVDCDMMESVGLEQLDNFFKELAPMLTNLKKAHFELKAKHDNFLRITEVDFLANYTLNDAIMTMIYCISASNCNARNCDDCWCKICKITDTSPFFSSYINLSKENKLIFKIWSEFVEILTWISIEVELPREFADVLGIQNKLTEDISNYINMENFNRNLQKFKVASKIAEETLKLAQNTLDSVKYTLRNISLRNIHPIATQARENRCFSPSQLILRYWPDQSRVLSKVSRQIMRMNLVLPPVNEIPTPKVDEESKQVASTSEDIACLVCLPLAEDAVELSCCSTIICEKCSSQLNSICPNCRKNFAAKPSLPIRRLIGNSPWSCACGHLTTRSEMKSHLEHCSASSC
jgi:hypothetical protein